MEHLRLESVPTPDQIHGLRDRLREEARVLEAALATVSAANPHSERWEIHPGSPPLADVQVSILEEGNIIRVRWAASFVPSASRGLSDSEVRCLEWFLADLVPILGEDYFLTTDRPEVD